MKALRYLYNTPAFLVGFLLATGLMVILAVKAVDGLGIFELDANAIDGGAAGEDWETLYDGGANTGGNSVVFTGIIPDPSPVSIFTTGGSKDINDVSEWMHTDGNVPDKDDITNAYAAGYIYDGPATAVHNPGDLIIYFGLDRHANNGDAQAGFWFFQDEVGPAPDGTFTGNHQPDDILVLVEYPQGANADPNIDVYAWDTSAPDNLRLLFSSSAPGQGDARCDGTGDKAVCASTNAVTEDAPWPFDAKFPDKSDSGSPFGDNFPFESFYEGGINISALLGGQVPCFSSFLAETRSSHSETAQLKDLVAGNFDVCAIDVTKSCTAAVINNGTEIEVSFNGTVTNSGALPLDVTVVDDNGTPADPSDDVEVYSGTLAAGASDNYSASYIVNELPSGGLTDVVTATGTRGEATVTATADATCSPDLTPDIMVTKNCTAALNEAGDTVLVSFNGTVTNTGNEALTGVSVVDDNGTPGDTSDDVEVAFISQLNAGDSQNYTGSFTTTNPSSTDIVVATGTGLFSGSPVQDDATATCAPDIIPDIMVTKNCTATINSTGDGIDVSFTGTVTNTGNVALSGVTVVDDRGTADTGDDITVFGPALLAKGESANYSGGFSTTGSTSTDTVTATGSDVISSTPVSDTASATCAADIIPDIMVTKECTDPAVFGDPILFFGTVTNTGNVALNNVTVVDDQGTADTSDDVTVLGPISLALGASMPYNGSYTVLVAGPSTDVVTATGEDAVDSTPVLATASATCEVPPPRLEGCTPGYWRNHLEQWAATGYSPGDDFDSTFGVDYFNPDITLEQAINANGGGFNKLARHGTAALLSAAHPDVDYPYTVAQVIAYVQAGDVDPLVEANELGCPIN